jgi:hypothetical protein
MVLVGEADLINGTVTESVLDSVLLKVMSADREEDFEMTLRAMQVN